MIKSKQKVYIIVAILLACLILINGCTIFPETTETKTSEPEIGPSDFVSAFLAFLNSFDESSGSEAQTPQQTVTQPEQTQQPVETIVLTAQRIQNIFQRYQWFRELPEDTAVVLAFYNQNKMMRTEKFFVSAGGQVTSYDGQEADLELIVGDYNVPSAEQTSDICTLLTKVAKAGDYEVNIYNLFGVFKYQYLKGCVSI